MAILRDSLLYTPAELGFGTSGLRGLVADMTDLECYINTRGFILFLQGNQKLASDATIYLAGDLRDSTPRILESVYQAIVDSGRKAVFGGYVPTPAIFFYGLEHNTASIMVTGSHIPADRNGIKFNKLGGEVLKDDEADIKRYVSLVRQQIYDEPVATSQFNSDGSLKIRPSLPSIDQTIGELFKHRYSIGFANDSLAGKKIVFYQHSCVGREMIPEILESLGAEVIRVDKTEHFVPIDTENVTPDDQVYFKKLASDYPDAFAIASTDGDSDRPFVIDEHGIFHRGDELGAVVATWLSADFAAFPISCSDGVTDFLTSRGVPWETTKIGSPYVIRAMEKNAGNVTVGWEVNGGFLIGNDIRTPDGNILKALPSRDAILPIVVALIAAAEAQVTVSALFDILPKRFTQAAMIDDFPAVISRHIVEKLSEDTVDTRAFIAQFFNPNNGFDTVNTINTLDGVRIYFANGDIAHLRPSGNAPQLRIYSVANSQERADEIAQLAIAEPDGIFRTIERALGD